MSRFSNRPCALFILLMLSAGTSHALDLSRAIVAVATNLSRPEQKAIAMLVEEVEKRTQIKWAVTSSWPTNAASVIAVGQVSNLNSFAGPHADKLRLDGDARAAEGFRIRVSAADSPPAVLIAGNDARGVLYGVGHLLRHLNMAKGTITLSNDFSVTTAPKYPLRGHQLGYRPKTHSYDAWDLKTWEQYYRDLIVFGANAVELIPPRSDDDADSPHFPLPPMPMMEG